MFFLRSKRKTNTLKTINLFTIVLLVILAYTPQAYGQSIDNRNESILIEKDKLTDYKKSLDANIEFLNKYQDNQKTITNFLDTFTTQIQCPDNLDSIIPENLDTYNSCIIIKQLKNIKIVISNENEINTLSKNSVFIDRILTTNLEFIPIEKLQLQNILNHANKIPDQLPKGQIEEANFNTYFSVEENKTKCPDEPDIKEICLKSPEVMFGFITNSEYTDNITQLQLSKSYLLGFLNGSQSSYVNNDNYAFMIISSAWGRWFAKVLSILILFALTSVFLKCLFPIKKIEKLIESINSGVDDSYDSEGKTKITSVYATKDPEDYSKVNITIKGDNLDKTEIIKLYDKPYKSKFKARHTIFLSVEALEVNLNYKQLDIHAIISLLDENDNNIFWCLKPFSNINKDSLKCGKPEIIEQDRNQIWWEFPIITNLDRQPLVKVIYSKDSIENSDGVFVPTRFIKNRQQLKLQVNVQNPTKIEKIIIYPSSNRIKPLVLSLKNHK